MLIGKTKGQTMKIANGCRAGFQLGFTVKYSRLVLRQRPYVPPPSYNRTSILLPRYWTALMCRLLCFVAAAIAVSCVSAQDVSHTDLIDALAKSKVYSDDSVTMSPDRELLAGFSKWGDDGLQHLRKCLSDDSRDVRHHSLLLLAELPGGNNILLETLKDKSSTVRSDILSMVGVVLRDNKFIPAAGELIHDEDESLAIQAIGVAGRTHLLKVASGLVQIMNSDNESRSKAAAYALAKMGIPDGAKIIVKDARENIDIPLWQGKVIDTLARSGSPDAVEYLLELFQNGMNMTKAEDEPAGMVFSTAEHKEMLNGKTAKGAGIMLTGRCASAIAAIGNPAAMPILQKGLEHPNKHVRTAAVRGLTAGDPTAGKALLKAMKGAPDEAYLIIYAIAKTNDKSLAPELSKYLDGPNRIDTIAALAMLGDKSVLESAIEASKATDERSKHMGVIAVAALSRDSDQARERLMEFFDDPSPRIRSSAFTWLAARGANQTLETAILRWVKERQDSNDIAYAVRALAKIGSAESMEYLQSLTQSKSANVRYTAALTRQAISGNEQIFVRDNGEKVKIVLTGYYASARLARLAER